jgi:hypothetical protein
MISLETTRSFEGSCVLLVDCNIVYHWTVVVGYYGDCVPLAVIVYHWTIVVYCYSNGCVPLDYTCVSWIGGRVENG